MEHWRRRQYTGVGGVVLEEEVSDWMEHAFAGVGHGSLFDMSDFAILQDVAEAWEELTTTLVLDTETSW
jgi:hypothetical protein